MILSLFVAGAVVVEVNVAVACARGLTSQDFSSSCPTRVSGRVLQECPTRVRVTVVQECPTRVPAKCGPQNVPQECLTRVSHKCPQRVFRKSVPVLLRPQNWPLGSAIYCVKGLLAGAASELRTW